jgi:hypothetical protein
VFCDGDDCDPARGERWQKRIAARRAEDRAAIEAEVALRTRERQELLRVYETDELDYPPEVLSSTDLDLPRHLLRHRMHGEVVVGVNINSRGDVVGAWIDHSTLGLADDWVLDQVADWKFTPPMHRGRPVNATAEVPLRIDIR